VTMCGGAECEVEGLVETVELLLMELLLAFDLGWAGGAGWRLGVRVVGVTRLCTVLPY
jgi:hypothetical protein